MPPLAIEACAFARAFADLSRNFREKSPTFQSGKPPTRHPQTHIHRLGALTSQAGYQTVASPGFITLPVQSQQSALISLEGRLSSKDKWLHISLIYKIQLRKTFASKKVTFATPSRIFRGATSTNTDGRRILNSLQGPLERLPYIYVYIHNIYIRITQLNKCPPCLNPFFLPSINMVNKTGLASQTQACCLLLEASLPLVTMLLLVPNCNMIATLVKSASAQTSLTQQHMSFSICEYDRAGVRSLDTNRQVRQEPVLTPEPELDACIGRTPISAEASRLRPAGLHGIGADAARWRAGAAPRRDPDQEGSSRGPSGVFATDPFPSHGILTWLQGSVCFSGTGLAADSRRSWKQPAR